MTSFFEKKVSEVADYDTHVIVDNFVETGDFSSCFVFWIKNTQCFLVKNCRRKFQKMKKTYLVNEGKPLIDQVV